MRGATAACLLSLASSAFAQTAAPLDWPAMLNRQAYSTIEAQADLLHKQSQRAPGSDLALERALLDFVRVDDRLNQQLRAWQRDRPDSPWAAIAAALQQCARAEGLREGKAEVELVARRRERLLLLYGDCAAALDRAARLAPALGVAYAQAIDLKAAGVAQGSARGLLSAARRGAPNSHAVVATLIRHSFRDGQEKTLRYLAQVARRAGRQRPDFAMLARAADCLIVRLHNPAEVARAQQLLQPARSFDDCRDSVIQALPEDSADQRALLDEQLSSPRFAEAAALQLSAQAQNAGEIAAATAAVDRAMDVLGARPALLRRRAWLQWRQGDARSARRLLERHLRADADDLSGWILLGQLRSHEPDAQLPAIRAYTQAATLMPSSADIWRELLQLQLRLDCARPVADFAQLCERLRCPSLITTDPALRQLAGRRALRCQLGGIP